MTELEAVLRGLAQWQDAVSRSADKRTVELAGYNQSLAYTHAADLARDHEAAKWEGGWMPIASAPRDGTWVLLYWPALHATDRRGVAILTSGRFGDGHWQRHGLWTPGDSPTHWRPLPEPPVAEGAG